MVKVIRCGRLNKAIFEKECLLIHDQAKENDDCRRCTSNPFKKPYRKKSTVSFKNNQITGNQEPWRLEAVTVSKEPFTDEQYKAIEQTLKPIINGFELRLKLKEAAIFYLAFKEQSEGRPRFAKVRKDLQRIEKLAGELSDLLHNKVDDDTLALLGDIQDKVYNYEDDVYKISMRAWSELKTFPSDPGGTKQWEIKGQKAYFQALANVYETATGRTIKRNISRITGSPIKEYKRALKFFRLCWETVNPEDKYLSDSALDSMIKRYVLTPAN